MGRGLITGFMLPHIAETQIPLNANLQNSKKKDMTPIAWTTESETAFNTGKKDLAQCVLMSYPLDFAPIRLITDASDFAVRAALEQKGMP